MKSTGAGADAGGAPPPVMSAVLVEFSVPALARFFRRRGAVPQFLRLDHGFRLPLPPAARLACAQGSALLRCRELRPGVAREYFRNLPLPLQPAALYPDLPLAGAGVAPDSPPVGDFRAVEARMGRAALAAAGLNGAGVRLVLLDHGFDAKKLERLFNRPLGGRDPDLDWSAHSRDTPGKTASAHGIMSAAAALLLAPGATLIDHIALKRPRASNRVFEGFVSNILISYRKLADALKAERRRGLFRALVINNSWSVLHPAWDYPPGDERNYSHNPDHPLTRLAAELEAHGADLIYAAGNSGGAQPYAGAGRFPDAGVVGAASASFALAVGGVDLSGAVTDYSTAGPGALVREKPDLCCYTHFLGPDRKLSHGTSTAAPLVAGLAAAVRERYSPESLSPADLRELLRRAASRSGAGGFALDRGAGILEGEATLMELREIKPRGGEP